MHPEVTMTPHLFSRARLVGTQAVLAVVPGLVSSVTLCAEDNPRASTVSGELEGVRTDKEQSITRPYLISPRANFELL